MATSNYFPVVVSRCASCSGGVLLALSFLAGCASVEDPRVSGQRWLSEGNHAEAAGAFRSATRTEPRDYQSYLYLGQAYEGMNAHQQAIQAYKSGLDVQKVMYGDPDGPAVRVKLLDALARAIAKSGTRDAETDAVEKKARSTQGAENYFLLAKISRYRGDPDLAIDYYNRAALIDNNNFALLKEYGLYLEQLPGLSAKAEAPLRRAYVLNATDAEVNEGLRTLGVVPGLSLRERSALAQPPVPKGPIPPLDLNKIKAGIGLGSRTPSPHFSDAAAPARATPVAYPPAAVAAPFPPVAGSSGGVPRD